MSLAFLAVNTAVATGLVGLFLSEKVACGRFSTLSWQWE